MSRIAEALAAELHDQAAALGWPGQPDWLPELRARGLERFRASGLPDRGVERWKYTPLSALEARSPGLLLEGAEADGQGVPAPLLPAAVRVLMRDGAWSGSDGQLADGVTVLPLAQALDDDRFRLRGLLQALDIEQRADAFAALNTAALREGLMIHVASGVDAGQIVLHWAASRRAQERVANPRACVLLGAGAQLELIEQFEGESGARAHLNLVVQIELGEEARLEHVRLQQEDGEGVLVTRTEVGQAAASGYRYTGLDRGGGLVRHDVRARLEQPGARCELAGASLTGGRAHVDNHLDVEHLAPECASEQWFRAVLAGRSRVVFNGRVLVAPGADGTDARQSSAGLLLSPHAEIDSKPELEIYADEVVASHGATIGQLDEDQLFYLRSRGLDEAGARNMLTAAFCRPVTGRLPPGRLREVLEEKLEAALQTAGVQDDG